MDLTSLHKQIAEYADGQAPVDKWDPSFCGDIDMQIRHDGRWFYMGTPIGRESMVRLFSRVIKREENNYFLVTPVEKIGIQVEDVPFIVTQWQEDKGRLAMTTNVGESFYVSDEHPVTLMLDKYSGDTLPYVNVRRNLWARLHQNVFYQLAEHGQATAWEGCEHLVLKSGNYTFSLGSLATD